MLEFHFDINRNHHILVTPVRGMWGRWRVVTIAYDVYVYIKVLYTVISFCADAKWRWHPIFIQSNLADGS